MSLEKHGSTLLGRLLDNKAKYKANKEMNEKIINESCTCTGGYQVIGCTAYDSGKCIWHPNNDPYGLKNRHWVDGKFVKKENNGK
jgi:hypothetical protein